MNSPRSDIDWKAKETSHELDQLKEQWLSPLQSTTPQNEKSLAQLIQNFLQQKKQTNEGASPLQRPSARKESFVSA